MKYLFTLLVSVCLLGICNSDKVVAQSGCTKYVNSPQNSPNFQTIRQGVAALVPGDTLCIGPGTYREQILMRPEDGHRSGTANAPIIIRGLDPNNRPVITNDRSALYQWVVIDLSHITLRDIAFENYYYSGVKFIAQKKSVSDIIIRNIRLYNQQVPDYRQPGYGGYFGIVATAVDRDYPMNRVRIENNYLEKIATKDPNGDGHECIRINGEVNYSVVENNTLVECQSLGIDILGADRAPAYNMAQPNYTVVRGNRFIDMYRTVNVATPTSIYMDRAGNFLLIEGNYNEGPSKLFKSNVESNPGNLEGYGDIIVRNNVNNGSTVGLVLGLGSSHDTAINAITNNKVVDRIATIHNTIITSDNAPPIAYYGSRFTSTKNNVFWSQNGTRMQQFATWLNDYPMFDVSNRESDGNLWFGSNQNTGTWDWGVNQTFRGLADYQNKTNQDKRSLFGQPMFVAVNNYRLQPETLGHGQGINLTTTTNQGDKVTVIAVADAKYFYDGWGIKGEIGDRIKVGGQEARVVSVNHETNVLTVDRDLTWSAGAAVNYYYDDEAPSMGLLDESFYDSGSDPVPTVSAAGINWVNVLEWMRNWGDEMKAGLVS